jgi:protein-tyrosine kinase
VERIQEALEKARRERANQTNMDVNTSSIEHTELSAEMENQASREHIEYTSTRRVHLDDLTLKARRILGGMVHDSRSDPYRQLRGQILQKMRTNNWQTLAITSPNAGNGKTLTAINLAISLSQEVNQTVLLVDVNLRSPGVAQLLGIDDLAYGITDYLFEQIPLEKILINPEYSRLVILPGNKCFEYSAEVLSSPQMRKLHEELKSRYQDRIIIFDLPPMLVSDDAISFIPQVDATLLVLEDGGATKAELERCTTLLNTCPLIGTVLNKVR